MWTQAQGLALVREIFEFLQAENFPAYPALTGGLAYKDGPRKDCDIALYMNRQHELALKRDVIRQLNKLPGLRIVRDYGFVTKWEYGGKAVDIMFPEWFVTGEDDYERNR